MIKILKNLSKYRLFHKAEFREATINPENPFRGWFTLYTYETDTAPEEFEKNTVLSTKDSLVLLLADISSAREREISGTELDNLERVIGFFRKNKKDVILRVVYDHEGCGMEREPFSFDIVKSHAVQIAEFTAGHYRDIFLYQGLLVGRWGEMHTSRFSSEDRLRELYEIFYKHLKDRVFMAVRRPVQWRQIKVQPDPGESLKVDMLGIFNDGMFGSDTDLGTYDNMDNGGIWRKPWKRESELRFIREVAESVPYGGEALFGEGFATIKEPVTYIDELALQQTTYLNRYHDIKLMDRWKEMKTGIKGIWNGSSYFDYIGAHLGYRFLIDNTEVYRESDGLEMCITVENRGFAPIYKDTELSVKVCGEAGESQRVLAGEKVLRGIKPGKREEVKVHIPNIRGSIYLYACDSDTGRPVMFVNQGTYPEGVLLGRIG